MKYLNFIKSYEGTLNENKWSRIIISALLIIAILLAFMAFNRKTIVTMQPITLVEDAWVTNNDSSISYKESWGYYLATLLGNVNPSTVTFLKERLGPILSPKVYNQAIDALESQSVQIINDKITLRFEPRFVEYEKSTNKIFVFGNSFIKGVNTDEQRTNRTYEFVIRISNYLPVLEYMDMYDDRPRTSEILERIERKEAAKNAKK